MLKRVISNGDRVEIYSASIVAVRVFLFFTTSEDAIRPILLAIFSTVMCAILMYSVLQILLIITFIVLEQLNTETGLIFEIFNKLSKLVDTVTTSKSLYTWIVMAVVSCIAYSTADVTFQTFDF